MRKIRFLVIAVAACVALYAFFYEAAAFELASRSGITVRVETVTRFEKPWAMTFLPDGSMLVTTKPGKLFHVTQKGKQTPVDGIWPVAYGGQGGLGDVVLHPQFVQNGFVYISSVEANDAGDKFGAVVRRAKLDRSGPAPKLTDIRRIWTQEPKTTGTGHYSHRMAFGPDGMLFITSGERQKLYPAQSFDTALGKIIRLHDDGTVPADNPWQDKGELARTFWTMGHRNMLGIDFDSHGRLWAHEMGPRHGDELNLITPGGNYGWPIVSNGDHYGGEEIPDHDTRPEFNAPAAYWVPAISPSGFVIYDGEMFPGWRGDGLMGGLSSKALVRVAFDGDSAKEVERFEWGRRIREVEQGPDGAVWVLEDLSGMSGGRLLKLTPKNWSGT